MALQTFTAGQILTAAQQLALQQNDYNQTVSTKTASYTLVAADVGTTINMNVSGASTVTVNTSLFSAGDKLQIRNLSASVVTITAGTATVQSASSLTLSQFQSGILYFLSAGVSYFEPTQAGAAIPFTPTVSGFGLGNGTVTASYSQIGKFVFYRGTFTLGSTSTSGANLDFNFPVAPNAFYGTTAVIAATAQYVKASPVAYYECGLWAIAASTMRAVVYNSSGTYLQRNAINATTPVVPVAGDAFQWSIVYEAA